MQSASVNFVLGEIGEGSLIQEYTVEFVEVDTAMHTYLAIYQFGSAGWKQQYYVVEKVWQPRLC